MNSARRAGPSIGELLAPARLGGSFRWLLASSWSTNLGDGVAAAAGPLLVASLTDSPPAIAAAALLRWAPPLVFGLYAGVLSDRHDRRRIVVLADGSRAVVLAVLVVALATDRLGVAGALLALGLLATAEVFADNTTATLTPMVVSSDDLVLANARLQVGLITLNQLAGPPLGAALFVAGQVWPFVTQAVLVAAGVLLIRRIRPVAPEARPRSTARREIREGVAWTVRHAAVRTLALTILIFNVTFGAAWSVLVLYAQDRLGLGAIGFGLITAVSAVGGLLGSVLYGPITARVSLGNVMRVGLVIETLTHLGLATTTSPLVALPIFFVFGAHAFIWGTTSTTVRQRAVPTHLQGRVGSVYTIGLYGGLVVGAAVGGVLADHFGVAAPFWFAFAGSAVFLALLWPSLTRIVHAEPPATP
ncbi:MFS transporter [Cryptosporangium arvum]|uniref:Arabinose efflux permease family protein n=1 Tax=Cryptosporangium arvum DSM 44712 TaxID=927661 RepID=A0A010Z394_9ACTN|nr:MFS transporter [Cryptosporangium arvum]EXG81883.1 arabinose efflux permease family protein [Cryptosporangium arvum DSM 44712]